MDPERFQLLSRLFQSALALDRGLRDAFVKAQCADDPPLERELAMLLAAHDAEEGDGALLEAGAPLTVSPFATGSRRADTGEPTQVGRYRIIRAIASGGMGTVYAAEQDEPRRPVAIKLLHPGLSDTSIVRRFEHEAQLLGRLHHPGIAHVYEVGTFGSEANRRPFIAMELIDGVAVNEHVRRAGLDANACLELVADIADAVAHAHGEGVVHRDLKPANILVGADGRPRILDFGVARAVGNDTMLATMQTETGQLIGTMPYMSPEQASGRVGDIDARADVYALGVVAFQLLTGRLPYDFEGRFPHEVLRIIREDEPTRLSTIDRSLRGDVETVIARALAKEPARRYQSAAEFAADLRRAARREAIHARPPSRVYRLRTFTRRHRGLVIGTALVFAALVVGMIATGAALIRALEAEALAADRLVRVSQEAEKAQAVNRFLQEMLASVDPRTARDPDLRMREVLDAAAARLAESDASVVPEVDAAIRQTIASTYRALGVYDSARRFGEEALRTRVELFGETHLDTAHSMDELAEILRESGELDEAETLNVAALRTRRALLEEPDAQIATSLNNLALVRRRQGRGDESRSLHEEALAMRRALYDGDHIEIVTSLNNLALAVFQHDRDAARADALLRECTEMLRRMFPTGHVNLASTLDSRASLASSRGDLEEAERLARESVAMRRRLLPAGHELIGEGLSNLGLILRRQDRFEEAEPFYRESLEIRRAVWRDDHDSVATSLNNLGQLLRITGRLDEAESMLREALDIRRRLFPTDHHLVALSANNLGMLLLDQRRPDEAAPMFAEAVGVMSRLPGDRRADEAHYAINLAVAHRERGAVAEAIEAARRALELRRAFLAPDHPLVAQTLIGLARLVLAHDGPAAAEPLAREAIDLLAPPAEASDALRQDASDLLRAIQLSFPAEPDADPE